MVKSDFQKYETYPENYSGDYRNMLNLLISKTWFGILYIVISVILIYSLGYFLSPIILFITCGIPTLIATFYVLFPNHNIRFTLLLNWIPTAALLLLLYLVQHVTDQDLLRDLSNYIGLMLWFFIIYWILLGIKWNISIIKKLESKFQNNVVWDMISRLMVIWGTTLQIAYFFAWFVLPFLKTLPSESIVLSSFINMIELIYNLSITRFLPMGLILLGLLLLASLKFNTNPYNPISFEEVLKAGKNAFLNILLQAIRLPVWLIIIIIGFISHFTKLMMQSIGEIGYSYLARLVFIAIGLFIAPIMFFIGHFLILFSFIELSSYLENASIFSFNNVLAFIEINFIFIIGLCFYVIAAPLLSLKYQGENIKNLINSIFTNLKRYGKTISIATGRTFSLFGLVAFVVPVSTLMPGGPTFGTFSIIYSSIILISLAFVFYKRKNIV